MTHPTLPNLPNQFGDEIIPPLFYKFKRNIIYNMYLTVSLTKPEGKHLVKNEVNTVNDGKCVDKSRTVPYGSIVEGTIFSSRHKSGSSRRIQGSGTTMILVLLAAGYVIASTRHNLTFAFNKVISQASERKNSVFTQMPARKVVSIVKQKVSKAMPKTTAGMLNPKELSCNVCNDFKTFQAHQLKMHKNLAHPNKGMKRKMESVNDDSKRSNLESSVVIVGQKEEEEVPNGVKEEEDPLSQPLSQQEGAEQESQPDSESLFDEVDDINYENSQEILDEINNANIFSPSVETSNIFTQDVGSLNMFNGSEQLTVVNRQLKENLTVMESKLTEAHSKNVELFTRNINLEREIEEEKEGRKSEVKRLIDENRRLKADIMEKHGVVFDKKKTKEPIVEKKVERTEKVETKEKFEKVDTKQTTASADRKIKCRYSNFEGGCQRSRCKFFHPAKDDFCEKWMKGGGCVDRFCLRIHSERERESRRVQYRHNERKRTRSEWSPNRDAKRSHLELVAGTRKLSIRDPAPSTHRTTRSTKPPLECREWSRRGRCNSAPSSASRCKDGLHTSQDLRQRAGRRAGLQAQPGRNHQSGR